jgi:hypothetical protein
LHSIVWLWTQSVTPRRRIMGVAEEDWYKPHSPRTPRRPPRVGELLFEFHVERVHKFYRCELRDHGQYRVEAQFLDPVELLYARTFGPWLDRTRTPREMAVAWAQEERTALERTG